MPSLLLPGAVVRHTYREMHALVPPTAAYSLTTPETITLSVPGTATASGRTYYAGASFTVQAVNENFALTVPPHRVQPTPRAPPHCRCCC
jgi:hypothetical protein